MTKYVLLTDHEGSSDYLVRSTYKVNGKIFESFKICL